MADREDLEDDDVPAGPGRRYLTRAGAERMHAELLRLLNTERPRVTAEVSAAAAQGDRSENAEYIYGKKKLRELDRRLRFLSTLLDDLTVVEPRPHPSGRAYFGAWVTVEADDGEERVYRLVGPDETDAAAGAISVDAPLGRALLGRAEGDVARVQRPAGAVEVTVLQVAWAAPGRPTGER